MNRNCLAIALAVPLLAAAAPSYHLVGHPMPAGFSANAFNARGDVAGRVAESEPNHFHAALVHDGKLTLEPEVFGFYNNEGTALTAQGDMYGALGDGGHCGSQPVLWPAGQPVQFIEGCARITATHGTGLTAGYNVGISDSNTCAYWKDGVKTTVYIQWGGFGNCEFLAMDTRGHYFAGFGDTDDFVGQHILLYTIDGGAQDLGSLPGYPVARANAVNVKGHTAGMAATSVSTPVSVAWFHDGVKATLLTPPGQRGAATALNDHDQAVGFGIDNDPPYATHGMLWEKGRAYELITLVDHPEGWTALAPAAIGPDGTIAGTGVKDGVPSFFVLEPIRP
jgi:hypothetical protein